MMMEACDFIAPLFVPADRPERFQKAAQSGADAVIIDLEDAVAPAAKETARQNLSASFTRLPVVIRINASTTEWHEDDVEAVAKLPACVVMVPKAEDPVRLRDLHLRIGKPLIALIETGRGLVSARDISGSEGVVRLAFGSVDYCADMGCGHTRHALSAARSEIVLASRLSNSLSPIDGITTSIDDNDMIVSDTRHGIEMGFGAKLAIHPKQISAIRSGFQPSEQEIVWANKVLNGGVGAVAVDGSMVDEPVRVRARSVLKRAGLTASSPHDV